MSIADYFLNLFVGIAINLFMLLPNDLAQFPVATFKANLAVLNSQFSSGLAFAKNFFPVEYAFKILSYTLILYFIIVGIKLFMWIKNSVLKAPVI